MSSFSSLRTRGRRLFLAALAALIVTGAGVSEAAPRPVKVMTRNLYLGADLTPSIASTSVPEFLAANASIFATVQRTDFPARARVLATEIQAADPILIGLQEVAIWRRGPVGVLDGPATPATEVAFDFLSSLRSELAARRIPYNVVRIQQEADLEAPAGAPFNRDIRLTIRDVILVKPVCPVRNSP
jgi:hypothetical protein